MRKQPKPTPWLILAALAALLGAGGMYWQYGSYSSKRAERDQLKKVVRSRRDVQMELEKSQQDLVEARTTLDHLEKGVPEFAYIPTMLKELEQFGLQHGLEVFGVRPLPVPDSDKEKKSKRNQKPYFELLIEVKGRGRYDAIRSFCEALRTFPKIVAVRAVSLEPKNESNAVDTSKLDMTIELKAFVFPPTEAEMEALTRSTEPAATPGAQTPGSAKPGSSAVNPQAPNAGPPNPSPVAAGPAAGGVLPAGRNPN